MKRASGAIKLFALIGTMLFINSCRNNADSLTSVQSSIVRDSVKQMVETIAKSISHEGPLAWLLYFENSPDFFMAADGQLVFPDNNAATNFLKNIYVKSVSRIELRWKDIHISPFTSKIAGVAAIFHEDITDTVGKMSPSDGYFTGIAEQTAQGWQLLNAHWSMIPAK
jgi:SnoaL-like domain